MRTALQHDSAVWLPGEAPGTHDIYRILDVATDLQLSVTVPRGAGEPGILVRNENEVVGVSVHATTTTKISVIVPTRDAVSIWRPGSHRDHARMAAIWEGAETISPLHDVALGALVGPGDRSLATFGATAGEAPLRVQFGVSEETAELMLFVEVDAHPDTPIALTVWVDHSGAEFSRSVQDMTARIYAGRAAPAHDVDELPVFSTWYVFHQELAQQETLDQVTVAAQMGFGTVIIDDGWQSTDTRRGYGSTGDWLIQPAKFPDPAGLVSAITHLGLRTMWWVGTPFIGDRSDSADVFPTVAHESQIEASVLDPRSDDVRAHLTERIVRLVADTGAHGVKLDFVERFAHVDQHGEEIEAAAVTLLRDIRHQLDAVSPGASIEFREPYIGPVATELATMIRVNDCPMSPARNRVGIIDLRLSTHAIAVHADPIMWADGDSPERVALHLINSLFGVPQISVDLLSLTEAHRDVLGHWIDFYNAHRQILLHGELTATRPDLSYPVVTARDAGTVITARYQPTALSVPPGDWTRWLIANTEADVTDFRGVVSATGAVQIAVLDARGRTLEQFTAHHLPTSLRIPAGGLAEMTRL